MAVARFRRIAPVVPAPKVADGAESTTRRQAGRVTIRDVAERAKVSLGTVSNVMNHPGIVAPSTRQRVLQTIEETGFVRSTAARQLSIGTSRTIGVVILDVANPFFTEMIRGAEDVLRDEGYVLLLCSTDESVPRETHYLGVLEEHRVAGVLITPANGDLARITGLSGRGVPVVLLVCSVTVDDVRGGELAAWHLFSQRHQRIVLVNGPTSIRQCADRRRGARRAARRAGLGAGSVVELPVPALTHEHGEAVVPSLLRLTPKPTGIMCANDLLALGVLRGLAAHGVPVPGEMAVVGYDDVAFASMLSPALSSVRQPKYELGAAAARMLLEETKGLPHEHRVLRYEPELVVRASSGRRLDEAATGS
jgi:LacI family transcriptional regulator